MRALRQATGLKAGTALEIASMPVIAVAPEAKAFITSSTPSPSVAVTTGCGVGAKSRPAALYRPVATSARMATMKA